MRSTASEETWVRATQEQALRDRGPRIFRQGDKQIALFWLDGEAFALDNRCPHQGYPLKEGTAEGGSCVLTCQWHNWKFDLKTGQCLQGEDHVRTYPTRLSDGFVWLDLRDPPSSERRASIVKGLQTAVEKRQYGRLCRELARLSIGGFDPVEALREALVWRSEHFEFGMNHAHAASADWLALYDESEGDREQQLLALAEAIDHIAHDTLRHPRYPYEGLSAAEPAGQERDTATSSHAMGGAFDGDALLAAIEGEDEAAALFQLRLGLDQELTWEQWESWLAKAALAHYNDFGHALIYVQKTGELITRLGSSVTQALLAPLIRALCMSTREDLVPNFRKYPGFLLEAPEPRGESVKGDETRWTGFDEATLESLWSMPTNQAMAWVNEQLSRAPVEGIYDALLESCARGLLHYDPRYQDAFDKPVAHNIGWLHFTHALTFANAVRTICQRQPSLWPAGLLQMACFSGRHQSYQDREQDVAGWFVDDPGSFFAQGLAKVCDHGLLPPIFSSHLLKTFVATRDEATRLMQPSTTSRRQQQRQRCLKYVLASCHRFLHASLKQKHPRRTMRQALALAS